MKFKGSIDIDQSLSKVVELFADSNNLKEWQEGFVKKELINGVEGENGTVSMLYYLNDKHKMELKETITANQLPDTFEAFYEHKHMDNTMKCSFTSLSDNQTRYKIEIEYTRINWIMPKLMAILFPNMYKKPVQKWMNNFKVFVEKQ